MEHQNDYGDFIGKKQIFISLTVILTIVLILFLTLFFLINNRITALHEDKEAEAPVFNETPTVSEETQYLIKEFNGKIGVYKNGDFQYLLEVFVFTLPENDKKLLLRGITVTSEQELNDILSSYY